MFSKKTQIAFIGAGKIAHSLIPVLQKSGYNITCVISKKKTSASKLSFQFKVPFSSGKIQSLNKETKIFFLTVPDDEIEKTAKSLSRLNLDFKNSLFIHVSGALNINELRSLKRKKAHTASFHIMQTFPSKEIVEIENCYAAIESEDKIVKDFLTTLALNIKLIPFQIEPGKKIYYHLAGVFASNFLAGNLYTAEKLFTQTKSGIKNFFPVYESIINSTLKNIKEKGTAKALSGPVERGDFITVQNHLKALKNIDERFYVIYLIQSLQLLKVSKEKNEKLNEGQNQIKKSLEKELIYLTKL